MAENKGILTLVHQIVTLVISPLIVASVIGIYYMSLDVHDLKRDMKAIKDILGIPQDIASR